MGKSLAVKWILQFKLSDQRNAVTTFFAMQTKDDRLLESVSNIYEAIPNADICVHYSIKWNYSGSEEHAMDLLNKFLEELSQLKGAKSVLLLSGGGKKKKLDTIKVTPAPRGPPALYKKSHL